MTTVQTIWPEPTAARPEDHILNYMLRREYRARPTSQAAMPDDHIDVDAEMAQDGHDCTCSPECGTCRDDGGEGCDGYQCECECGTCENDGSCPGHDCTCEHCERQCPGCDTAHCDGCEGGSDAEAGSTACPCRVCAVDSSAGHAVVCTDGCVLAGTDPGLVCTHGHATWLRHFRMA